MKSSNNRYEKNLIKTLELIDLVFTLKEAYLKKKYPDYSINDIHTKIYTDMLKRKNN